MSRTIKLSIRARAYSDVPTVEDLLDQILDYFAILEGVEELSRKMVGKPSNGG